MSKIVDVAGKGDRRKTLEAVRDRLAAELDDIDGRYAAPLAKELRNVMAEIDRLPGGEEESPLDVIARSVPADELAPRRANRKPGASP